MTTMYDAIAPLAERIPPTAPVVAGYIDGANVTDRWTDAQWNLFPHAVKIRIAVLASTNDGHVLDVENGDARPEDVPRWVTARLTHLPRATVYCGQSNWPAVKRALEPFPNLAAYTDYWLADPTGTDHVLPGTIGTQWLWTPNFDQSTMLPSWWPLASGGDVPNANCVAFKPTKTGKGYWLVGSDGGVFTEGDAPFHGSIPGNNIHLNAPVIGFDVTPDEGGYWLVSQDYGVFAFGNAEFLGHP